MIIDVKRGNFVESTHECSVAVVDADGAILEQDGDISRPVFPRSALKAIQAMAMVESGAAEKFGFTDQELALCCSSHSGEDRHAQLAEGMLAKLGLDERALKCGPSWPDNQFHARKYAANGGHPRPLRHACSGKHSGFLCLACHQNNELETYINHDHPVQREVTAVIEALTGYVLNDIPEIDGCSVPAHRIPLSAIARGFALFATGTNLPTARKQAANKLYSACTNYPEMVGGERRYDTRLMEAGNGAVFAKMGAQGVYCGALRDKSIGIALKCHDGNIAAAEIAFGCIVEKYTQEYVPNQCVRVLKNAAGRVVGSIEQRH